jgi:hypothetical protein
MANIFTDIFGNEIDLNGTYAHDWDWNLPKKPNTPAQNPKTSVPQIEEFKTTNTNNIILYVTLGLALFLILKNK